MNCEGFSEALSACLDGELSAEERSRLDAHLEGCPRCQKELQSLRAVSRLVASLPEVTPSPAFLSALGRGFERRRRWLRPIPLFKGDLVPALAVAAFALIVVTMLLVIPSVRPLRRAVEPYEAAPLSAKPESPAPSAGPRAGGTTIDGLDGRVAAPASPALGAERGLMELAEKKAGPPAPTAPPYRGQAEQQARLAGRKDGGGATARDELAGAYAPAPGAAPAKAEESEADHLMPMANVMAPPGAGGEARVAAAPPAAEMAKAAEAGAREARPTAAAKEAPQAQLQIGFAQGQPPQGPAFLLVTLRCTDNQAGLTAFDAALSEFATLRSPQPQLASTRPMAQEEEQRYSQVLRDVRQSADVVAFRELTVPAADVELVQGVFAGRPDLTIADQAADTARLQDLVSARRAALAARTPVAGARAPEAAPSSTTAGSAVSRAKAAPTEGELVRVIVALRRQR